VTLDDRSCKTGDADSRIDAALKAAIHQPCRRATKGNHMADASRKGHPARRLAVGGREALPKLGACPAGRMGVGVDVQTEGRLCKSYGRLSGAQARFPLNKIQSALTELERAGAITRRSVFIRNKAQRRIWPWGEIVGEIPPDVGGMDTPRREDKHTPRVGGRESLVEGSFTKSAISQAKISATQDAARKDAAIRERSTERKRGGPP
jgi:hypothetical protein